MAGLIFKWGPWRFEPAEAKLTRDGVDVPLPAKTLDLLATLMKRAPRLVTKEEILANVWQDAAVEEGNIAFHVNALRKVLDEGDESCIETVRGKGYRFVETLKVQEQMSTNAMRAASLSPLTGVNPAPHAADSARMAPAAVTVQRRGYRTWILGTAAVALIGVAAIGARMWLQKTWSVAVQPFTMIEPLEGQEQFPDGLATYITSSLALAGIKQSPPASATAQLTGQVRPTAEGFRVSIQLINSEDGERIWNYVFDVSRDENKPSPESGPDDERSRVQGLIAGRIADGLRRYLTFKGDAPATR